MRETMQGMKRQELVTYAATALNVPRGTMLRATGDSIMDAVESNDPSLLRTVSGSPLIQSDGSSSVPSGSGGDLASMIAASVAPLISVKADSILSEVMEAVDARLEAFTPQSSPMIVDVRKWDGTTIKVGRVHPLYSTLLTFVSADIAVMLKGPAGSGKTFTAEQVAKALSLPFYAQSVGMQTSKSDLMGYMDAHGNYVRSLFRQAYEHGGIFLLDEVDAGNANVLTCLNAALANGVCAFPDGMINRHPDFRCIAAANTFGTGADAQYIGRNQLDAATLDRFAVIEWPYDEALETDIATAYADASTKATIANWIAYVQKVRAVAATLRIRHVISPRASINGAKALRNGADKATVETVCLWKGITADDKAKIEANL